MGFRSWFWAWFRSPPRAGCAATAPSSRREVYGALKDAMRQRAVSAVARRLDQEKIAHVDRVEVGDPVATILRVAARGGCRPDSARRRPARCRAAHAARDRTVGCDSDEPGRAAGNRARGRRQVVRLTFRVRTSVTGTLAGCRTNCLLLGVDRPWEGAAAHDRASLRPPAATSHRGAPYWRPSAWPCRSPRCGGWRGRRRRPA